MLWQHEYVGKNYNAEVGYVPRHGYIRLNPLISHLYFPKGKNVLSHGPSLTSSLFFNNSFRSTDNETIASYLITFRSRSTLNLWVSHNYVKLLAPLILLTRAVTRLRPARSIILMPMALILSPNPKVF